LSLGQQQRVALARALARQSHLILLDEPFSALDAPLRRRLCYEMLALQAEIDTTTILVTHDPEEAMLLADEVLLLADGHVLQSGPVEAVFQRPASEVAARLLGAENVAAGRAVAGDCIDVGGVCLKVSGPALPLGPVGWSIRPTSVRLGSERLGGEPNYPAEVLQVSAIRAGQRHLIVRLGQAQLNVTADPSCAAELAVLREGRCQVSIDPAALQVWPASQPGVTLTERSTPSVTVEVA
jgi:molybdate transport system permease protein